MALHHHFLPLISLIFTTLLLSQALATPPYLLPILKDAAKPQYYTTFPLGTPSFRINLSIDLSNPWSWFTCNSVGNNETIYQPVPKSSTYRPIRCSSSSASACDPYDSHFCYDCDYPACASAKGQVCGTEPYGPYLYTHNADQGHFIAPLLTDEITIYKSNTQQTHTKAKLPNFPFGCGYISELKGLSQHTKGVLSLARKHSSLPYLISKAFKVPRKFALCLPSSSNSNLNGAIYFGGGPYFSLPNLPLATTKLVVNPIDVGVTFYKGKSSVDYFVKVNAILVGNEPIKVNPNLLAINRNGIGGTKLSTIDAYTIFHTEIYDALVSSFAAKAAAMNITRVNSVGSFGACFTTRKFVGTKTGPKVPNIEIVFDGGGKWRIYGANSMEKVSDNVRCLAFMNGGSGVKTSIVIGGRQMEDNLIEFDLEASRLRVTSNLLNYGISCSQFKGV